MHSVVVFFEYQIPQTNVIHPHCIGVAAERFQRQFAFELFFTDV